MFPILYCAASAAITLAGLSGWGPQIWLVVWLLIINAVLLYWLFKK